MFLATNSIQAYLFSKIINVITETGPALSAASSYWALRFFILGIGAGTAYFILGYSSQNLSTVRTSPHIDAKLWHVVGYLDYISTTILRKHSSQTSLFLRSRRELERYSHCTCCQRSHTITAIAWHKHGDGIYRYPELDWLYHHCFCIWLEVCIPPPLYSPIY